MFRTVPLSIIRSFSLYAQQWCMSYMFADSLWAGFRIELQFHPEACNTDTTQTQPHQISNTQRTENKTTDVVIQQHSRKLPMMDILISETCWVHKKWNKIASDIKFVFYSSTITMMHGRINITFTVIEVKVQSLEQITGRVLNCSLGEKNNTDQLYWFELVPSKQLTMLLPVLSAYSNCWCKRSKRAE